MIPPLHESEQEGDGHEGRADPDEPPSVERGPREADQHPGAAEPGLGEDVRARIVPYFLRKAESAARKSGVVRLTALTSAERRMPSSNGIPSS